MPKFKINFHTKKMSTGPSASPNTPEQDFSYSKEVNIRNECPSSMRTNRMFNFRKGFGSKFGNTVSMGGTANQTRTPITSLFSSKQTRTLKTRHHRQYAVSLSQFLQARSDPEADVVNINQMLLPAEDPESPPERAQRRRLNSAAVSRTPLTPESPPCARDHTTSRQANIICRSESFNSGIAASSVVTRVHSDRQTISPSHRHSEGFAIKCDFSTCSAYDQNSKNPSSDLLAEISEETHELYRVAEIIQKATRDICADQKYSQALIFRSLTPITIFVYLFFLAIIVPRQISKSDSETGINPSLWAMAFGGLLLSLAALRTSIWTVGVIAQGFCDADLKDLLGRDGIRTANGGRVGQVELVAGIFA